MQNLTELCDFDYGCPSSSWFGLWCPLLDCFVLVTDNLQQLQKIQSLTVSKILTVLVKLDERLHQRNVIDNSCACNWTLTDSEAINFTLVFKKHFHMPLVADLEPSNLRNPEQVNRVQLWLFFVWKWIKYMDDCLNDNFINMTTLIFENNPATELQREIYKILLLEDDPDRADQLIQQKLQFHV